MKQVYRLSLFFIVSAIAFAAFALPTQSIRVVESPLSIHLTLGNPSDATTRTNKPDNFLMLKDQYALSFNNSNGGPNWVSWHLERRDLGRRDRANDFRPDDSLPDDFTHVSYSDLCKNRL
jgi:endonuclease G